MEETWKPIEQLKGKYEISNLGKIRGVRSKKVLKLFESNAGYLQARVHKGNNINITVYVHRLVAMAFIPNSENKRDVNHKDGNKLNNFVGNLEWVTPKENTEHAQKMGLMNVQGENHPRAKLTEQDVKNIRHSYIRGSREFGLSSLARKYGVEKNAIYNIIHCRTWKHMEEVENGK